MKIVLFLGAGFPAAYDYPTMNDFLSFADSSKRLSPDQKAFVGRLVLAARSANSFLQSSPTNLEDILSFSVMADRLSLSNTDEESQNDKIKQILQKIFTNVENANNFWVKFSYFKTFLTFNPATESIHDFSVITTNYNLSIECAIKVLGRDINPGFKFIQEQNDENSGISGHLYSKNGIPVYKLHGSVNWFKIEEHPDSFRVEDRIAHLARQSPKEDYPSLPYICSQYYKGSTTPVIVPPSFLKPDLELPLNEIWRGAAKALEGANILIFVGYSFPLTDTDMMYFLARSLTNNPGLRRILIVDPFADDIVRKLNSSESKFGSHFKALIQTKNAHWEDTDLHNYL